MGMTIDGCYLWTRNILRADSVIKTKAPAGVHRGSIPQQVKGVGVVMQFYAGDVLSVVNGITVYERITLTVKAIGERKDWEDMVTVADQIHSLLHMARDGQSGDTDILVCQYMAPIHYPEVGNTVIYENLGGRFQYTAVAT